MAAEISPRQGGDPITSPLVPPKQKTCTNAKIALVAVLAAAALGAVVFGVFVILAQQGVCLQGFNSFCYNIQPQWLSYIGTAVAGVFLLVSVSGFIAMVRRHMNKNNSPQISVEPEKPLSKDGQKPQVQMSDSQDFDSSTFTNSSPQISIEQDKSLSEDEQKSQVQLSDSQDFDSSVFPEKNEWIMTEVEEVSELVQDVSVLHTFHYKPMQPGFFYTMNFPKKGAPNTHIYGLKFITLSHKSIEYYSSEEKRQAYIEESLGDQYSFNKIEELITAVRQTEEVALHCRQDNDYWPCEIRYKEKEFFAIIFRQESDWSFAVWCDAFERQIAMLSYSSKLGYKNAKAHKAESDN